MRLADKVALITGSTLEFERPLVNCVCPGDVDIPMLPEDARAGNLRWEDYLAGCASRPMGRLGTADEIAKAVLVLASDDSSFMTGAALVVDGGGTAT